MAGTTGTLGYTKFLFVTTSRDDDAAGSRMRTAGSQVARGFFNDYDADGTREAPPHETIQFLVAEGDANGRDGLAGARYVAQVSAKYQGRLDEIETELRRRVGDAGEVVALDGEARSPRYTSAEMHDYAYQRAAVRQSGRVASNAFILPLSKTAEWWAMDPIERQAYFYPHTDRATGNAVPGHARAAERAIASVHRRLYHNPRGEGQGRAGEFDFLTCFECADEDVPTFEAVLAALRDPARNPEWRFVREGPLWRGRRVLRW